MEDSRSNIISKNQFIFHLSIAECRKDLLLVVDTSTSIGEDDFNKNVKPFLKNLITAPSLNVGPDGTHISLIVFGQPDRTEIKLKFKAKEKPEELVKEIDNLVWKDLEGYHTRTDLGLELAEEVRGQFHFL